MTDRAKRLMLKWASLATVAGASLLAGCGKKEDAVPAAPAASVAATPASVAAPPPLKIGFVYVGPVGDAGWTFAHDTGRKAIEAKFGDKIKPASSRKCPRAPTLNA